MNEYKKRNLLFIDPNDDWLKFVRSTLGTTGKYEIETATTFEKLAESVEAKRYFDLIFIGMSIFHENIDVLSGLAQSSSWHFIVLFPGFPDGKTSRIFFRAGVRDLLSKPYDSETLKNMIEEELSVVEKNQKRIGEIKNNNDEYISRVFRLQKSVQSRPLKPPTSINSKLT